MTEIFHEIDEQLRHDRALALWKRYGRYLIGLAVVLVAGVGGYRFWIYQDLANRASYSTNYQSAVTDQADVEDNVLAEAFGALAADSGGGYVALSRLQQAGAASRAGDGEGAILAYQAVAVDDSVPPALRALARLKAAAEQVAGAPGDDMSTILDALALNGNPWQPMARELQAIKAMESGDKDTAREIFTELVDDEATPDGLRTRAAEALEALAIK